MKKLLALTSLAMILSAPMAGAAGLNLNWNTCTLGPGLANLSDACTAQFGAPYVLICSVDPPDMPNFVAATGIVSLVVSPDLGQWWHYETGGCRAGKLALAVDFGVSGPFDCPDPWNTQSGGAPNYVVTGPNTADIQWVAARPTGTHLDPTVAPDWYLAKLSLLKTAPNTACPGCLNPACLVFRFCRLQEPAGGLDITLTGPAARQHVTWQGGGTIPCPGATPTHKGTWGSVKALYR